MENAPLQTRGPSRARDAAALAGFAGATAGTAWLGSLAMRRSNARWYARLKKPPFQPPAEVFPVVWTGLYALMTLSGYRLWKRPPSEARHRGLRLWGAQLAANGLWSWLFFAGQRKKTALADVGLLGGLVAGYIAQARRADRGAAMLFLPYLGWVSFAALLNEELVRRNPASPVRLAALRKRLALH